MYGFCLSVNIYRFAKSCQTSVQEPGYGTRCTSAGCLGAPRPFSPVQYRQLWSTPTGIHRPIRPNDVVHHPAATSYTVQQRRRTPTDRRQSVHCFTRSGRAAVVQRRARDVRTTLDNTDQRCTTLEYVNNVGPITANNDQVPVKQSPTHDLQP